MVRYVLVGGYPWKATDGGKAFVDACLENTKSSITLLVCLFARDEPEWEQAFQDDVARFSPYLAGRQVNFLLAAKHDFANQVAKADVIYLRGGDTEQLISALGDDMSWLEHLDGKTLVGTSAGADAIATYYYALENPRIARGLGLLPIKVLVHYESDYGKRATDWRQVYQQLDSYGELLEIVPLREGQFVIRESRAKAWPVK